MGPLVALALFYAGVFAALGLIILYVAREMPTLGAWNLVRPWGYIHLALSIIAVFAFMVFAQEQLTTPACGYVPNTSTTIGGVTSYTWTNTCAGIAKSPFFGYLITVYSWVLILEAVILVFVGIPLAIWNVFKGAAP